MLEKNDDNSRFKQSHCKLAPSLKCEFPKDAIRRGPHLRGYLHREDAATAAWHHDAGYKPEALPDRSNNERLSVRGERSRQGQ